MSPKTLRCIARGPNLSALRTPDHLAGGTGGFQRSWPTGGWANGIPLKDCTPVAGLNVPSRTPATVLTWFSVRDFAISSALCVMEIIKIMAGINLSIWRFARLPNDARVGQNVMRG